MHRGALGAGGLTCLWWAGRIKFPTNSCRTNEAQRFCYIFESFSVSDLKTWAGVDPKEMTLLTFLLTVPHGSRKPESMQKLEWFITSELQSLVLGWRPNTKNLAQFWLALSPSVIPISCWCAEQMYPLLFSVCSLGPSSARNVSVVDLM